MFRKIFLIIAVLSTLSLEGADYQKPEKFIIESIDFEMLSSDVTINSKSLRSRIKSRQGEYFSQITFDSDLKALVKEFDMIEPVLEVVDGKMYITIKLNVKPRIRSIQFRGNKNYTNSKLLSEISISPGEAFDGFKFNTAFHKLKTFYIQKGYFEAVLDYEVVRDPVTNEIDIIVTVCEGRTGKIKEICFQGFSPYEEQCLLELMLTKKWNFLTCFFSNDGIYHEEMIQHDQYQITNFIQNQGYADASVTITTGETPKKGGIILNISVDKGERYSIGKVTFEGNTLYSDEEISSCFSVCEGGFYSPEAIRETATRISDKYGACGYIDNIVDYDLNLDPDNPIYDISITIEEGEQYRVGMIKILGNCSTKNSVILHEILMVPGELFNSECLKLTEERLKNIGYFKCVNVYAVRTENPSLLNGNYRDVHIEVEECPTGNISAFFGLSTQEGGFGGVHLTEKNFNARGLLDIFRHGPGALRGGGEYLNLSTTIGNKSRSYALSWTKPYFNDTPWIVGFDIDTSNVRYISKAYDVDAWGFNFHARYPLNLCTRFGTHYRFRDSRTKDRVKTNPNDPNADPCEAIGLREIRADSRIKGIISAVGSGLYYDSTDSIAKPLRGMRSRLEGEYAGIGGDHRFWSLAYANVRYIPVTCNSVFKIRADMKYIFPLGNTTYESLPLDERLFIGGNLIVRGYEPFAIGPKYTGTDEPRGGISLNIYSLEYAYYMSKRFELFTFFDAGMLSKSEWSFGNLDTSAGFGVRMCILDSGPPLTLGLGFPIKPERKNDIKRFFFSFGGSF